MWRVMSLKEGLGLVLILCVVAILAGGGGWYAGYHRLVPWEGEYLGVQDYLLVHGLIEENYPFEFDDEGLIRGSINGMVASLDDDYSDWLNEEEYERVLRRDGERWEGLGIYYVVVGNDVVVEEILPSSPAEIGEIKEGDIVRKVNGIDAKDWLGTKEFEDQGQSVVVELLRDGNTVDLIAQLDSFEVPDVVVEDWGQGAYVKVYRFGKGLREKMKAKDWRDMAFMVIDLRNNSGGFTEEALNLADEYVEKGVLMREVYRGKEEVHEATGGGVWEELRVVVLVNERTASAAEQFAAALQGNGRAKVVGEQTYGKATVGGFIDLDDGSAVYLVQGYWMKPDGNSVADLGLEPDVGIDEVVGGEDEVREAAEVLVGNVMNP